MKSRRVEPRGVDRRYETKLKASIASRIDRSMDRRLNTSKVLSRRFRRRHDDDEGYRGMASDETMDDAPGASDEAREPLLKRVGASVEGTSLMNHRLMKNPKFRALLVESVRGTRRDATRRDATVNSHARRLT